MRSELLETESDTLLVVVEVEDNNLNLRIQLNDFFRMSNASPRQVGDVDETVNTAQVDKYTVAGDILNSTFEYLTFFELRDNLLLLFFEFCLDESLVRNNYVLEFVVNLHNLEFHSLANEYVVVADWLNINL